MKIKKVFILIIFLCLFLGACTLENKQKNKTVRLCEVTRSVFYAPQYVALELGYFKENGLDISLNSADGSDKAMTAVLAHQADIALLGSAAALSVCSQGKESCPVLFSQITKKDGSFIVGRNNENFSFENLKGKEVIAGRRGGVPEMVFEHILKKLGVYKDVKINKSIKFELMGAAFGRGIGDYVCLFEPTASTLKKEKSFYILKPLSSECENISYTAYCAMPDYIKENPEVIRAFTNAIYKAQVWIKTHSAGEISKLIIPYFVDCSPEILTSCIENYISCDVWCENPVIKEKELDFLEDIMLQAGELKEKIDFNRLVENKFAYESLGS